MVKLTEYENVEVKLLQHNYHYFYIITKKITYCKAHRTILVRVDDVGKPLAATCTCCRRKFRQSRIREQIR